jgi:hypothetical protein
MVHDEWAVACAHDATTAFNRRDWSAFETLHRHDVVYESPHNPRVVGRRAVIRRNRELVALIPDLHLSAPRMTKSEPGERRATFEYLQTGTLADGGPSRERGTASPFVIHTTMHVRFDEDGRIAALRTVHR